MGQNGNITNVLVDCEILDTMKNQPHEFQMQITPEMVATEHHLLCKLCGGDLWLLNIVTKIALVANPMIGQPLIDVNLIQHVCLTCLLGGTLTLRTPQNTHLRKDAGSGN